MRLEKRHQSVSNTDTRPKDISHRVDIAQDVVITKLYPENKIKSKQTGFLAWVKRVFDVVTSSIALVLLSPVFAFIAIAIKLDSQGPAIFKQPRLGKDGKEFVLYKFRSMKADNDESIHRDYVTKLILGEALDNLKGESGSFKIERDPRVTRIGNLLRKTSLDELPQLLNVVKGEMSLVGPRPPLKYEVENYAPNHVRRLGVMPGITGYWQVNGRNEKTFEEMVELDLFYIDNWSFWLDQKILIKTASAVMNRKGAW